MLQQAIHLLQLSTVELHELVQKELEDNPLLEETPPDADQTDPDLPLDSAAVLFRPPEERGLGQREETEETRFESFGGTLTSLADHLDEQLRLTVVESDVRAAAEEIIGMNRPGFPGGSIA
jgi:RNA polymerase sigma-54 factor